MYKSTIFQKKFLRVWFEKFNCIIIKSPWINTAQLTSYFINLYFHPSPQSCHIIIDFKYKKSISQLLVPNHNFTDQETEAQIWNEPRWCPQGPDCKHKNISWQWGFSLSLLSFWLTSWLIIVLRMKDESQSHWWPISIYLQEHKCHKYHFYES